MNADSQRVTILRHAETEVVPTTPVDDWHLTEKGLKASKDLANSGVFDNVDGIFSSNTYKAHATALPVSERLGLDIIQIPALTELYRGSPLMSDEEYFERVASVLSFPPIYVRDWEKPEDALQRFNKAIDEISERGMNILVVSHGLIISLYFAECLGKRDIAFERWKQLKFLSWGTLSNGKVLKDVV